MHFEWNSNKAQKNLHKHGASFDEASGVFYDALAVTGDDPDHSENERRMVTFGKSKNNQLLVVTHTERNNAIRIISARPATKHEWRIYEEG